MTGSSLSMDYMPACAEMHPVVDAGRESRGFCISGGLGEGLVVGFVVFATAEIDVLRLFEAAFKVDHGVDLVIRKNEAIPGGIVS